MRIFIFVTMCIILSSSNITSVQAGSLFNSECGLGYINRIQQNKDHDGDYAPLEIEVDITGIPQIGTPKDKKVAITETGGSGTYYEYNALERISNSAMIAMQYRLPVRLASRSSDCTKDYTKIVVQICTDIETCRNF